MTSLSDTDNMAGRQPLNFEQWPSNSYHWINLPESVLHHRSKSSHARSIVDYAMRDEHDFWIYGIWSVSYQLSGQFLSQQNNFNRQAFSSFLPSSVYFPLRSSDYSIFFLLKRIWVRYYWDLTNKWNRRQQFLVKYHIDPQVSHFLAWSFHRFVLQ